MAQKLTNRNPVSNAGALVTIEGVTGYFSKASRIEITTARASYSDGLALVERKVGSGKTTVSNITLERAMDPVEDEGFLAWIEANRRAVEPFEATIRYVDRQNDVTQRGEKAWRLTGCRIAKLSIGEIDTADGASAVPIMLEFSVEQASFE